MKYDKQPQIDQDVDMGEWASALLDDQCDAHMLDTLLGQDDSRWQKQLRSYALARQLVSNEPLPRACRHFDLLSRVQQGIAADDVPLPESLSPAPPSTAVTALPTIMTSKWSYMAMAASVVMALVLGMNFATPDGGANLSIVESSIPLKMDEPLQMYLRQHAEHATLTAGQGMIPMARVVNYVVAQR